MSLRPSALGPVAALLLAAFPAAAGLSDLAGTKPGELPEGGQFEGAEGCLLCHGGGYQDDHTYLPFDSWAGTMMGNAARDPVFRAALAVANQDAPGIGVFCLRCHSPIAFVRGHATPPDGSAFDAVDNQGVGCDTCHRAVSAGPAGAPYYRGDAQIVYTSETDKHGPYEGSAAPVHKSLLDKQLSSAYFCGQCHQVTNPERKLRDASGKETEFAFPLDTTLEEWENSAFSGPGGESCIDCHTRRRAGEAPVATTIGAPARHDPRDHAFAGGNLFGIRAVMAASPERASVFPGAFELALARTEETLRAAATIQIVAAPAAAAPGAPLEITVRVDNLTGHKFPTGYAEGRRAWIALSLAGDDGLESPLLGAYDEATGEIQSEPATHIYRAQHGRFTGSAGEPMERLALSDMILSDTRIPPKGFIATATTAPTPEIDYTDGMGGLRSFDEATFKVAAPASAHGEARLVARVYYQSMTRHYVEHLAAENVTDQSGADLLAMYHALGEAPPFAVASTEVMIDFGGDGGSGGAGGAGGGPDKPIPEAPEEVTSCACAEGAGGGAGGAGAGWLTFAALALAWARRGRVTG